METTSLADVLYFLAHPARNKYMLWKFRFAYLERLFQQSGSFPETVYM